MRHVSWFVVLLSLLSTVGGEAQSQKRVIRQRSDAPSAEERAVARALIEDALREAGGLKAPENLLLIRSAAASLLQDEDPERAAALIAEIAPALKTLIDNTEPNSVERSAFTGVRANLIQQLAAKEENVPAAIKFLHDSQPQRANEGNLRGDEVTELELLARLASREPDQARKALLHSLETNGFTQTAPMILPRQLRDNPGAARATLDLLLAHLRDNTFDSRDLFYAQLNLLQMLDSELHRPKTIVMRSDAVKVAEAIAASANDISGSSPFSDAGFANIVRVYSPSSYEVVRKKWEEMAKAQSYSQANNARVYETTDVDKALEAVDVAPTDQRPYLYQQVAMNAASRGDIEQARRVLEQKFRDPDDRSRMLKDIARQSAFYLAQKGDVAGAMAQLREAGLRRTEKIQALVQIAMQSTPENRKEPLDEALKLVPNPPPDAAELQNLLIVTQASSQFDPAGAEETLAPLIALLNQQMTSVAAVDGFANGRNAFRNNELLLVGGGYPSSQYMQIIQQIAQLSSGAPERALRLARQLGTPELRAYSMLSIAGRILRKPVFVSYGGGCSCY